MTIATPRRMTIEEYLGYDDGTDTPYMLRDGVLVTMGAESDRNVSVAMFLISIFLQVLPYSLLRRGTEIAVPGTNAETRYPDLMVLTEAGRSALAGAKRSLITFDMPAPALVVEVVSNSERDKASRDRDYEDKRTEYAGRGIPEYWIVDPVKQVVLVLTLVDGVYEAVEFSGESAILSPAFSSLTITTAQILAAGE